MSKSTNWSSISTLDSALTHGLTEKEFLGLKELLGRELSVLEIGICAALYSEHCSYKSTKVHLRGLPTQGSRVLQGPGENAGIVDIGDNLAVAFKVESHNHPSFIEPYQGAATGVGGILRDIFTMGARPIALMNALRFGERDNSKTKNLLGRAVAGIGGYGNCMGIPTVGGELFFHSSYNGNCLVNAFALGVVRHDGIFLGKASGVGNPVIYVGSKTGRDGIHGATMASEGFDENSDEKRPTVQVGDPFQEKLLLEACLEVMTGDAVVGIQDMGAAGMTCATFEMADRASSGMRVHLERIPQREQGMTPYDIMLSESQERMLVVAKAGREKEVIDIFKHWELDAVVVGEVVDGGNVELFWQNELVSSMPATLLTSSVPEYRWPEEKPADYDNRFLSTEDLDSLIASPKKEDLAACWLKLLSSVNLCSRRPVFNQYDSTVRSNTVVHPGGDAGVVRVKESKNGKKGLAMTLDCNSRYCAIDPREGTALSVAEAYRNISAVGATPLAISDCLNFGSPEKSEGMWEIAESIRGLSEAARAFSAPIISGNVSLYNETKGKAIYPTPLIALVGLVEDASLCPGSNFVKENDVIYLIGATNPNELGSSEYLAFVKGVEKGPLPSLNYDLEIAHAIFVREAIEKRLLASCHDLSSGGLAIALAESCFGTYGALGAVLDASDWEGSAVGLMFSETGSRYLVSLDPQAEEAFKELALKHNITLSLRGHVGGDQVELAGIANLDLNQAYKVWASGLNSLLG